MVWFGFLLQKLLKRPLKNVLDQSIHMLLGKVDSLQLFDEEQQRKLHSYLESHLEKTGNLLLKELSFILHIGNFNVMIEFIVLLLPVGVFYLIDQTIFTSKNVFGLIALFVIMFIIFIIYNMLFVNYLWNHFLGIGRETMILFVMACYIPIFFTLESSTDVLTNLVTKKSFSIRSKM